MEYISVNDILSLGNNNKDPKDRDLIRKVDYQTNQDKWIKENDIQVEDKVKVIRKSEGYENGWNNNWLPAMDILIGKTLMISSILSDSDGILLEEYRWAVPYFVLEKCKLS